MTPADTGDEDRPPRSTWPAYVPDWLRRDVADARERVSKLENALVTERGRIDGLAATVKGLGERVEPIHEAARDRARDAKRLGTIAKIVTGLFALASAVLAFWKGWLNAGAPPPAP